MLTITAAVNGKPVGRIFIHNNGKEIHRGDLRICHYDVGVETAKDLILGIEEVPHFHKQSWWILLQRVLGKLPYVMREWQ